MIYVRPKAQFSREVLGRSCILSEAHLQYLQPFVERAIQQDKSIPHVHLEIDPLVDPSNLKSTGRAVYDITVWGRNCELNSPSSDTLKKVITMCQCHIEDTTVAVESARGLPSTHHPTFEFSIQKLNDGNDKLVVKFQPHSAASSFEKCVQVLSRCEEMKDVKPGGPIPKEMASKNNIMQIAGIVAGVAAAALYWMFPSSSS